MFLFSSGKYQEMELLDCMVVLFSVFWGTSVVFSVVATPVYILISSTWGFPFLHVLVNTMLNKSGKTEHLCLVSLVEYGINCGFVIYGHYYVELCSLCTYFVENFYDKWMLNFVKCFFCICWEDHMIFILHFVNVYDD